MLSEFAKERNTGRQGQTKRMSTKRQYFTRWRSKAIEITWKSWLRFACELRDIKLHDVKCSRYIWSTYSMVRAFKHTRWRRLHGTRRGHVPPLLQIAAHGGGTVSSRTASKKLTNLYWSSRKRSLKWLIVLFRAKMLRGTSKKIFFQRFAPDRSPHFQICSGANEHTHPLAGHLVHGARQLTITAQSAQRTEAAGKLFLPIVSCIQYASELRNANSSRILILVNIFRRFHVMDVCW